MRTLLDIPDLPLGAFEHFGDRRIKLYGPVNSALDAGSNLLDQGSNALDKAGKGISKAIDNVVTNIEKDPVGSIAKITTAIVAPAYLPAVVVADAIGQGAPLDKALEQGAKSYVAGQVGSAVSNTLGTPDVGGVTGPDNIDVGGGFNPSTGTGSGDVITAAAAAPLTSKPVANAAGSTASNIVMGQDPVTALVNGGVQAGVATIAPSIPGYDQLSSAQQKAVNIVVATALSKGDPSQALVNAAINAGINEARAQYNAPKPPATIAMGENISAPVITASDTSTPLQMMGSIGATSPSIPEPMSSTLPGGTQVASIDGALPTVDVNQMQSPVYADSQTIGNVKAPAGYELMPASLNEKDANGNWLRPAGAYYDEYQNAWFMPSAEDTQSIKDLQAQLQNTSMPEVTTITDTTTTDSNPLSTVVQSSAPSTTGALPTTTEQPVDQIPEIVVTAPRPDPYTGDIQMDLSGQPTNTTVVTPTTTPTTTPAPAVNLSSSAASTMLGNFPASGSNVGQTTTATPTLGALPTAPNPTMLAAAPLEKQNMVLSELTQLYPQLANIDPRLLQVLSGKAKATGYYNYGSSSGGSTPLMNAGSVTAPSSGMPFKTQTPSSSNVAGLTSSSGSGALSRAGLSMLDSNNTISGYAKGGLAEHNPEFITGATGHHVKGEGDGQSDSIPAMLADGEYVFDADTVAALGNGSNDAGARILDKMRQNIRTHKRSAPAGKIPPKAKSPLEYMKG